MDELGTDLRCMLAAGIKIYGRTTFINRIRYAGVHCVRTSLLINVTPDPDSVLRANNLRDI